MGYGSSGLRADKSIQPTTLIQFSGGIDSTFVLYNWLINNPSEYCLVHHINIKNHEGRMLLEANAVKNILSWLDSKGLKNYLYIENTFDYGNLGYIVKDVEVCGFHIGIIFRNTRWAMLKKVVMPIYKPEQVARHERAKGIADIVSFNKPIEMLFPLINLTKQEVMKMLPKELLQLCWYCRKPVGSKICGKCETCMEVKGA